MDETKDDIYEQLIKCYEKQVDILSERVDHLTAQMELRNDCFRYMLESTSRPADCTRSFPECKCVRMWGRK